MADEDLKIALVNIVEGIESYLNNFIRLRENPSRPYWLEETTMSKLEGKKIFEKSILAKREGIDMLDNGESIWIFNFGL